ncbi:hypothetical protein BP00DRAFT_154520 [Aspergillus indologenus CBS 114.80]|uniref:Uncharacterized protein n=1 Tax=Aspergillus indologenus CBS 114.80 TaxID=1450541 RepID=A0A2V5J4P5_9EURO|nr:hypothetical protein BP00DRAFT_154520 [Aspergillus indologenus CBS 114.80]
MVVLRRRASTFTRSPSEGQDKLSAPSPIWSHNRLRSSHKSHCIKVRVLSVLYYLYSSSIPNLDRPLPPQSTNPAPTSTPEANRPHMNPIYTTQPSTDEPTPDTTKRTSGILQELIN